MKNIFPCLLLLSLITTSGCENTADTYLVGTLERDRIALLAVRSEPVVAVHVREGDRVAKGDPILELDDAVAQAEHERLAALARAAKRRVDELVRGPREEAIREAQARLAGATGLLENAQREYRRLQELHADRLASAAALDAARAAQEARQGEHDAARAALQALLEGTTIEELDQARAQHEAALAALHAQELVIARLSVSAPRAARVEAIPFEQGSEPPAGAEVAVLLADGPPFVRSYIPVAWRDAYTRGMKVTVHVPGFGNFPGRVRWVSASATFTPYFALTEHDRDRLSHATEIELLGDAAENLPAGLPVEVHAAQEDAP